MDIKEKIEELRAELHRHNYNYYVLNAPEISDKEFDDKMRELQDLEQAHPEYKDENSPTMRVGSDLNKNFTQVAHKYPTLKLYFMSILNFPRIFILSIFNLVYNIYWIYIFIIYYSFKMKMISCRISSCTYFCNNLSSFNYISFFNYI